LLQHYRMVVAQAVKAERVGACQDASYLVLAAGTHRFDVRVKVTGRQSQCRIAQPVERPDYVGWAQWRAVVEADPLSKREGECEAVIRDLPAASQARDQLVVCVDVDEVVVN